jgi:AraC-like DNA-binding protein
MSHPADRPFGPAPALLPYVARYADIAIDVPPGDRLVQRVSPPGGATLSFRWSGTVTILGAVPMAQPPPITFTGPITAGGVTACSGRLRLFAVFFTAAGAHDLFGLDMRRFADRSVAAEPVVGEWTGALAAALARGAAADERCALADAALLERLELRPAPRGLGARAAAAIHARCGMGPVAQVPAALGVSARTLRRHFLREVGVPLKAYARWVRFSRAHEYLHGPERRSWVEAADAFGYSDQAHLVREYHHFSGEPPSHLTEGARLFDPAFAAATGGTAST